MIQRTELLGEDCRLTALGIQLRDAREAMGLTDVDAAERLYISVTHIRAMEEARYELLPAEVFARGYLRSERATSKLMPTSSALAMVATSTGPKTNRRTEARS